METKIKLFIESNKDKNLCVLIKDITTEVTILDKTKNYLQYKIYIGDFLFFLNTGNIPLGIGKEGVKLFLPIIENLVNKGQMNESILKIFQ